VEAERDGRPLRRQILKVSACSAPRLGCSFDQHPVVGPGNASSRHALELGRKSTWRHDRCIHTGYPADASTKSEEDPQTFWKIDHYDVVEVGQTQAVRPLKERIVTIRGILLPAAGRVLG
jgi:hypothetical protein